MARLKSDFFYELPEELIAQVPLKNRDASRLLIYRARDGFTVDGQFLDIIDYLKKGDVLVINNTRVIPARIFGKKQSGARVEFLLHKRKGVADAATTFKIPRKSRAGLSGPDSPHEKRAGSQLINRFSLVFVEINRHFLYDKTHRKHHSSHNLPQRPLLSPLAQDNAPRTHLPLR